MVFLKGFLWFLFFGIAFFCWLVLLEHGPGDFAEGVRLELDGLRRLLGNG